MAKSRGVLSTVIYIVSILFLFALVIGVLLFANNMFENGGRNFYVQYGNESLGLEKKNVVLENNKAHAFYCKAVTGQTVDYEVHLYLNVNNFDDFDFAVDGSGRIFKRDLVAYDCSDLFAVTKNETCFFVYVPSDLTLQTIIQSKYPDSTVTGIPDYDLTKSNSFILAVTDSVEKTTTQIYFC